MFKDNIKAARLRKGLTQQQIAEHMGITKSAYCGYETGKRQPDISKLSQIAQLLDTTADELLGVMHSGKSKDEGTSLSVAALCIANDYESLDEHGRKVARVVIDAEKERMVAEQARFADEEQRVKKLAQLRKRVEDMNKEIDGLKEEISHLKGDDDPPYHVLYNIFNK